MTVESDAGAGPWRQPRNPYIIVMTDRKGVQTRVDDTWSPNSIAAMIGALKVVEGEGRRVKKMTIGVSRVARSRIRAWRRLLCLAKSDEGLRCTLLIGHTIPRQHEHDGTVWW